MKQSKMLPYLVAIGIILFICVGIIEYDEISARVNAPDSDGELSTWEFIKTCLIIIISLVMVGCGRFWLFIFVLILLATIFSVIGLGAILNLEDIKFAAGIVFIFLYIGISSLKDFLGRGK